MGYRDDFYKKENIIGYTGNLQGLCTVYFADAGVLNPKTVEVNGKQQILTSFGRITQDYPDPGNIGRAKVNESFSYAMTNGGKRDGKDREKECFYGGREIKTTGRRKKGEKNEPSPFQTSGERFESVTSNRKSTRLIYSKRS